MRYKNSHLSKKELHRIWNDLHHALETNPQLWLQPASLKVFCDLLHTNQNYFSQTVGQATGGNIYTLIHCYRMEHFLQKLKEGEANLKTIEGLMQEVGFKNRSSFYAAFRKIIGCTVSEMITQFTQDEAPTYP